MRRRKRRARGRGGEREGGRRGRGGEGKEEEERGRRRGGGRKGGGGGAISSHTDKQGEATDYTCSTRAPSALLLVIIFIATNTFLFSCHYFLVTIYYYCESNLNAMRGQLGRHVKIINLRSAPRLNYGCPQEGLHVTE